MSGAIKLPDFHRIDVAAAKLDERLQAAPDGDAPRYTLLTAAMVAAMPDCGWIIKHVLPAKGLVVWFGAPGSGKSFLVFDALAAVESGAEWFGHRTKRRPIVYVQLEGIPGLPKRVNAYLQENGPDSLGDMRFVTVPFSLLDGGDIKELAAIIKETGGPGAVVCLDTLSRAAPGADENKPDDMGAIIAGASALQAALDGLVIVVHHTGKDATRGARGHSSLTGAMDVGIEVTREGKTESRAWCIVKSKDGGDGETQPFRLKSVQVGVDEDGDAITSCVIDHGAPPAQDHHPAQAILDASAMAAIVGMVDDFHSRGEIISTSTTAHNNAYRALRGERAFPRSVGKDGFWRLLRDAERAGLIVREEYLDSYRKTRERYRPAAAPSAPSAPSLNESAEAAEGAPSAPSYAGGCGGESAARNEGANHKPRSKKTRAPRPKKPASADDAGIGGAA